MEVSVHVEVMCYISIPEVLEGPAWCNYPRDLAAADAVARGRVAFREHAVDLRVDDSATLRQVLDLAADEFGICVRNRPGQTVASVISGLGFYYDGDETTADIPWGRTPSRLPVIDEQGCLWIVDFREATLAGLRRASAAELLDGDVLRPYLRPTIPKGLRRRSKTGSLSSTVSRGYGQNSGTLNRRACRWPWQT